MTKVGRDVKADTVKGNLGILLREESECIFRISESRALNYAETTTSTNEK